MSCVINASTTSGLVMTSDLSGQLSFQNNGVAVPPLTVAPAFSAYASTGTAVGASTWTKITFDTESFDTNSNFASSRFTPTVAGYYNISCCIGLSSTAAQNCWVAIYKNGSVWQYGSLMTQAVSVGGLNNMAGLVYCNGSTDYIEIYGLSSTAQTLATGAAFTYFNGSLARSA